MKRLTKQGIAYWLPRLLSLLYVGFLALFATDVFSEYSGVAVIVPLLIHLIPALVLLGVVMLAWKYELVGAIVFLGAAVFYVVDVGWGKPWSWYVAIALPAAIVGLLYLMEWSKKKKK